MDRRTFLLRSGLITLGGVAVTHFPALAQAAQKSYSLSFDADLYRRFQSPESVYNPFARWWWIENIISEEELCRSLRLMKGAGFGGVEINPIGFPERDDPAGMLSQAKKWLSDEWIDLLDVTLKEAARLDMSCDLLVGSGWPFGGEFLREEEMAQTVRVEAIELEGPQTFTLSEFDLFSRVDPDTTTPSKVRTFELMQLQLVPAPFLSPEQVIDCSARIGQRMIQIDVPAGKHFLYAVVRVTAFAEVINGAPGAGGPILDHMNRAAVWRYLNVMSGKIIDRIGPLRGRLRAMYTDSMELEGANWTGDMAAEFERRRGYDLMPYLPYILLKAGKLGETLNVSFGVEKSPAFQEFLNRVRYDFELTKAELLKERFNGTFIEWCKSIGVLSRAQNYGRGFFPMESNLGYDIPEGESWTTNWLKHRLGEEMSNEDYRRGRGYTMINKFVSSAAHLTGRRIVSCEEMTNTYNVFNATLDFLKLGSDMSVISGITHSVLGGVNCCPQSVPFPGWVRYGSYLSEHNNLWPYLHYLTDYRGRVSALLEHASMYTDIAILPAYGDMWTEWGVQTEPFPMRINVPYMTLLWEAMVKNGNGCDYTSEMILAGSNVQKGKLCYGPKRYGTLFLAGVRGIQPETMARIDEFVRSGGRVFCVERYPDHSLGAGRSAERDAQVAAWVETLKGFPDRFVLLDIPEDKDFIGWYAAVQQQYRITPFVQVHAPDPYFMFNRYQSDDRSEIFFLLNARRYERYRGRITFAREITAGRKSSLWDPHSGERYSLALERDGSLELDLGPEESLILVFDKQGASQKWNPLPYRGAQPRRLGGWDVELRHSREKWSKTIRMETLEDLKETEFAHFTGDAIYRTRFRLEDPSATVLNLGAVHGISEVTFNGKPLGVTWYGDRLYDLAPHLTSGENTLEVKVVTVLGNYMKTLTENKTAQYWTVIPRKDQPMQSMGLIGPVELYGAR